MGRGRDDYIVGRRDAARTAGWGDRTVRLADCWVDQLSRGRGRNGRGRYDQNMIRRKVVFPTQSSRLALDKAHWTPIRKKNRPELVKFLF